MLELEEARARILAAVPAPVAELVSLSQADRRMLLERVISPIDLPPFDNSAMDGYAVRAAEVQAARADAPVHLRLVGRVAAGETFPEEPGPGSCVRIFTGSPLPRGTDAVVMQEDTRVEPGHPGEVLILEAASAGENVRRRGEDIGAGALLVEAGLALNPCRLSLLAAAGVPQVRVGRRPLVGLLATGSELSESGETLRPGQIYESNRLGIAALVRRAGGLPKLFHPVPDALTATRSALAEAFEQCDAVITSGGVSVGETDFVKTAFTELGGAVRFWKVAIKPGRPFLFGQWGGKLLFGVPGNPVSALVTFLLLVRPALLQWQGAVEIFPASSPGILAESLANPGPRRHFLRVKADAIGRVHSAGLQASHALSSLAAANGLVEVPPRTTLEPGTPVQVMHWG